tara:strand:- start:19553 stop:21448 length:1896 start_codon:yes stop_codon:yes gene_type:complete
MIINISKNPIINAFYGTLIKKMNVMNIILKNIDKKICLNNKLFKKDPCPGKLKKIFITLKNNNKYEFYENSIIIISQKEIKLIIDSTNNIKSIQKNTVVQKIINNVTKKKIITNNKFNYILSTNVRDENNILEFLIYHIMIGFDKILVIDHLSIEKVIDKIQILPLEYKEKIEIIRFEKEGPHKIYFLNNIVIPYMKINCNKYFIHLDGDEYINLNNNFNNINELMNSFNNPNILLLNWILFGSNNKKNNDNKYKCLIPTYTKCDNKVNKHFKILINVNILDKNTLFINPHIIISHKTDLIYTNVNNHKLNVNNKSARNNICYKFDMSNDISNLKCYINHYFVQSEEDYLLRKINRIRDDINNTRKMTDTIFQKFNNIENNNLLYYYKIIENILEVEDLTFVILRYVVDKNTDKTWKDCYTNIRKFYNNKIVIIDDHSNKNYISKIKLENCFVINSEFKGRGELLPYYYFLKNRFSKKIIVLHDSMILHEKIDFSNITNFKNFTRVFSFPNKAYKLDIKYFNHFCNNIKNGDKVLYYHNNNKHTLIGCFGVCYYIEYDFLKKIQDKYNITNLIHFIDSRDKRKTLERFLSCLFEMEYDSSKLPHLIGDIFKTLKKQKLNENVLIYKKFYGR